MDIKELVRYNHSIRRLYFKALTKLPWSEVIKSRGSSFDSMRNIFIHLTIVEDRWINYIILDRYKDWTTPSPNDFKEFDTLKKYMLHVEEKTEDYLTKITPEELSKRIVIPWGDTPDTRISIETALTHMVAEDLIHYGELSDLLWQIDVEPPYLAFWRYKYNLDNRNKEPK
ncbi:MAG: DinB family protein [Candidatus Bathyarchaeota archaeon]|nr:MAG: DinB family protein [Candidatus Bathyarchaeota archaeon]